MKMKHRIDNDKDYLNNLKEYFFKFYKSFAKKIDIFISSSKKKILIIACATILLVGGLIYLLLYLFTPNFDDLNNNFLETISNDPLSPGDVITYKIHYKNTGLRSVNEFKIVNLLPKYSKFIEGSENCFFNEKNGVIEFDIGRLNSKKFSEVWYSVKVESPLDNGTQISNENMKFLYRVGNKNMEKDIENNSILTVQSSPDFSKSSFSIKDENGGALRNGDILSFYVKVKNIGDMNAKNSKVVLNIAEYLSISENGLEIDNKTWDDKLWDSSKRIFTINIGDIDVKTEKDIKLLTEVEGIQTDETLLKNSMKIVSDQIEWSLEGKDLVVRIFPDFSTSEVYVVDENGGSAWAGDTLTYTLKIRNTGDKNAINAQIYCPIPSGSTYINQSATKEGVSWNDDIGGLMWTFDKFGIGEEKVLNFRTSVNIVYKPITVTLNPYLESNELESLELSDVSLNIKPNIYLTMVALGNSQVAKTTWVERLDALLENTYPHADYKTIKYGYSGAKITVGYRHANEALSHNPQVFLIGYGTNDSGSGMGSSRFGSYLGRIIDVAKTKMSTIIVYSTAPIDLGKWPFKSNYMDFNNVARSVAASKQVIFVDICSPLKGDMYKYLQPDGLHLNENGSAKVAEIIFHVLKNYLNELGARKL
jgi:acyl-CoA thioesterase-1